MRYAQEHKEAARKRLVYGVGRGFRRLGFGGAGVDLLAKEAGVTSGAFYSHFNSKAEAFRAVVEVGLGDLREGVEQLQAEDPTHWVSSLITFYLTERRVCGLDESCALQSLSAEVARSDAATRKTYEHELLKLVDTLRQGLETRPNVSQELWGLLALLSGGVTMARAVENPEVAERIVEGVRATALRLVAVLPLGTITRVD